jgi:hypothetical protein
MERAESKLRRYYLGMIDDEGKLRAIEAEGSDYRYRKPRIFDL